MLTNTATRFGSLTKTFHWLTALLILTAIALGLIAEDIAHAARAPGATQEQISRAASLFSLHKTIGIAAFFTALARILWAISQPRPGLLNGDNRPESTAAETIHWLLYGAMVITPLSGWIHHAASSGFAPILWPFGQTLPLVPQSQTIAEASSAIHYAAQWALIAAIALHVLGALKHHLIDRDDTLRRMLPRRQVTQSPSRQQPGHALPILAAALIWAGILGTSLAPSLGTTAAPQAAAATQETQTSTGNWQVSQGTLGLTVRQMGSDVSGQFATWQADITFDETATTEVKGQVKATIDIASLTLGSVTGQALGADFLNAAAHPQATFQADIHQTAQGYEAIGTLTLNGQTAPLTLPFTLDIQGDTATMQGSATIARLDFGIGQTMPDGSTLGLDVTVPITLTATRTE